MLALSSAALSFNGALPAVRSQRARGAVMETKEDLKALAMEVRLQPHAAAPACLNPSLQGPHHHPEWVLS